MRLRVPLLYFSPSSTWLRYSRHIIHATLPKCLPINRWREVVPSLYTSCSLHQLLSQQIHSLASLLFLQRTYCLRHSLPLLPSTRRRGSIAHRKLRRCIECFYKPTAIGQCCIIGLSDGPEAKVVQLAGHKLLTLALVMYGCMSHAYATRDQHCCVAVSAVHLEDVVRLSPNINM